MRFSDARLHALSFMDMYSLHGFEASIRPVFGSVCHLLIVVSYWTPGRRTPTLRPRSASAGRARRASRARCRPCAVRFHSLPSITASMKASVTRTELFAFWYWIDAQSGESRVMS